MDGEALRRRRLALGLNQSQMARTLGVPVQTVARWERGQLGIRHGVMLDYALRWLELERGRALLTVALADAAPALAREDGDDGDGS